MSLFSNALRSALDDLGWSQTYLSERTGIPRPQINRYARGTSSIEVDGLEKILKEMAPPHNSKILAAYLEDSIPPNCGQLVHLLIPTGRVQETADELPSNLDPELRKTIIQLAMLASRHTEIADLLTKFLAAMHPRK